MTEKPNDAPHPSDEDDVQAHAIRVRFGAEQPAETEAHAMRGRGRDEDVPEAEQVTEREHSSDDGSDVEGHGYRFKG